MLSITQSTRTLQGPFAGLGSGDGSYRNRYGAILSGFDVCMPSLLALLVARYDAWLAVPSNTNTAAMLEVEMTSRGAAAVAAVAGATGAPPPPRNYSFLAQAVTAAYRFVYRYAKRNSAEC